MMKERFKQIKRVIGGTNVFVYIKEQKMFWWSKWKVVMKEGAPLLFYKLPEGVRAINELPNYKLNDEHKVPWYGVRTPTGSQMLPPLPMFPKGDADVRISMADMVRQADEVYVGIKQDGKYYIAYDTESRQSLLDLQSLELGDDEEE